MLGKKRPRELRLPSSATCKSEALTSAIADSNHPMQLELNDVKRNKHDQHLLLLDLDAVEKAMDDHIATVQVCRAQSLALRALIASGADVREGLSNGPMSGLRHSLTESIEQLESARHQSRLSLVAVGLREGMTIGDFGRIWGISRQLASRYAREARSHEAAPKTATAS